MTSWLSLTDTFQNGDSFTEMGIGVFGTATFYNLCHTRGVLIKDLDHSKVDSNSSEVMT